MLNCGQRLENPCVGFSSLTQGLGFSRSLCWPGPTSFLSLSRLLCQPSPTCPMPSRYPPKALMLLSGYLSTTEAPVVVPTRQCSAPHWNYSFRRCHKGALLHICNTQHWSWTAAPALKLDRLKSQEVLPPLLQWCSISCVLVQFSTKGESETRS